MICPARFIALAEAAGLIDAVTDQVIDQALHWFSRHCPQPGSRQAGTASAAADAGVQLSVNLSARTLRDVDFVERIMARCDAYGVPTSRITVELTETSAMEDPISSLELLTRLRMKGFHLSIDDFGTGYSSMLQLVRLPFSEIKVDKSFVLGATESPEARAVVKSIIDLGHSLGLKATAEGVEDAATLDLLRTLGCDQAQGYVIARPMPGNVVDEWVQTTFAAA
jgi:EAL domain-containing protein (putative c-di-GMP-specific phosphodiesterase class I)